MLLGKTYKSKFGAYDLSVTFKKNGKVSGRTGPQGSWMSNGKYNIQKDGTVCIDWDHPQWMDHCRLYGSPNRVIFD